MSDKTKMAEFLREVSNWYWDDFHKAEYDKTFTSNQSVIFSLIRACAMEQMDAIRLALNRMDGKLKTPVQIEYPKIYYLYPNAKLANPVTKKSKTLPTGTIKKIKTPKLAPKPDSEDDLPSLSLRETLSKMSDYPRDVPEFIVQYATQTDQAMQGNAELPAEVPRVKSVVAAHLLMMAQKRDIGALTEVFDQIDGKLVETIQLLGEDIYITSYALEAPKGAYLNEKGVLQIEATQAQDLWAAKLGKVAEE